MKINQDYWEEAIERQKKALRHDLVMSLFVKLMLLSAGLLCVALTVSATS